MTTAAPTACPCCGTPIHVYGDDMGTFAKCTEPECYVVWGPYPEHWWPWEDEEVNDRDPDT